MVTHNKHNCLPVPLTDIPVTKDQLYVLKLALVLLCQHMDKGIPLLMESHISGNDPEKFTDQLLTKINALYTLMANGINPGVIVVKDTTGE